MHEQEVLADARLRLKVLRNVARDALAACARAELVLQQMAQPTKEAQPHEHHDQARERVGV